MIWWNKFKAQEVFISKSSQMSSNTPKSLSLKNKATSTPKIFKSNRYLNMKSSRTKDSTPERRRFHSMLEYRTTTLDSMSARDRAPSSNTSITMVSMRILTFWMIIVLWLKKMRNWRKTTRHSIMSIRYCLMSRACPRWVSYRSSCKPMEKLVSCRLPVLLAGLVKLWNREWILHKLTSNSLERFQSFINEICRSRLL